jgi:hypothetical protein
VVYHLDEFIRHELRWQPFMPLRHDRPHFLFKSKNSASSIGKKNYPEAESAQPRNWRIPSLGARK